MGVLSACTVTVKESDDDKGKPDAAVSRDDSSDRNSNTSDTSDRSTNSDDSEATSDTSGEPGDTVDVTLDGGATTDEDETSAEGDGGTGGGAVAFNCGDRSTEGATVVEGAVDKDVTWSGVVHVKRYVTVRDKVKVTIEPGTRFIMAVDSGIDFGWNNGATTVTANGTEDKPITFCGEEDDAGYWGSIVFGTNVTSNTTFKNVLVADGGGDNDAALILKADIHLNNVKVLNSGNVGVKAADFANDSEKLSVVGANGYPVVITDPAALTPFPLGGEFEDNHDNYVFLDFTSITGTKTYRFHEVGIPYLQARYINIQGSSVVEYAPGVVYKLSSDGYIEFGWNGSDPTIRIQGTEDAPVVFEGLEPNAGYWQGLYFNPNVRTSSTVSNMILRHAGGDNEYALEISSPIKFTNISLDTIEKGAWIGARGVHKDSANLTITGAEGIPLTVVPDGLVTIPRGGTFTGNEDDVIAIDGTSYQAKGTVANLGVPYRLLRYLNTSSGAEMTIEAGTVWEMAADSYIEFGWNSATTKIVAVGTEEEPIVFKGVDEAPGSWRNLHVNSKVTSDSKFEWVTIAHAGNAGRPVDGYALELNAAIPISHVTFDNIAGYGIGVFGTGNADLVVDCSATGDTLGVILPQP
jgi:hypothetical protein